MGEKLLIGSIICMGVCMLIIFILPQVGISVADFIIGAQNKDATCDDGALVKLSTWLFVNGAIGLFFALMMVVMFVIIIAVAITNPKFIVAPLVPLIIMILVFSSFSLAWNIVGAVALFRDSTECLNKTTPLWAMVLANLILQWLAMAPTCLGSGSVIKVKDIES